MKWRLPRLLLLGICVVFVIGIGLVVTLVFRARHTATAPLHTSPQATVIPHNEREVIQKYNQAIIQQDWATIYTSSSIGAWGGYSQGEFAQLMSQQVQKHGAIVSITPTSTVSNPEIKTNADYLTYFSVIEKFVSVKNGISQTASYGVTFILENGTWKFFTSKKI